MKKVSLFTKLPVWGKLAYLLCMFGIFVSISALYLCFFADEPSFVLWVFGLGIVCGSGMTYGLTLLMFFFDKDYVESDSAEESADK